MQEQRLLEYFPFTSSVNPSFWHKLTEIKLNIDKLSESGRSIWGYYSNLAFNLCNASLFEVDSTSFNIECAAQNLNLPAHGVLLNKNTIEQFKDCDKIELIKNESGKIWGYIKNGKALEDPSLLNFFFILSFADLKKYHYYYWFCFPAPPKININVDKIIPITEVFDKSTLLKISTAYTQLDQNQKPFFLIKATNNSAEIQTLKSIKDLKDVASLKEYYFAFSDPSASAEHPGWPLRNYIAFLMHNCSFVSGGSINVLSFRLSREGKEVTSNRSIVFNLILPSLLKLEDFNPDNTWVGWERNERAKFGPRLCNMKSSIDPKCLAETSVDLNLKLMKWQLLPDINLEIIKQTKCLLLGAGTLGCSVARTLLGWGVRNINFVDNASVSFSNPVRQSLFTYEDCVKNKTKAEAAAESLKEIFPGVNSKGCHLTIPMPGHPVGASLLSQTKESVQTLSKLVSEHDVIFLLMDSRESRWLPTLLGRFYNKIVINAALGFDTYLVMRHGCRSSYSENIDVGSSSGKMKAIPGHKLGCYFCNDVTAPGNSLKNRTLDQQCTVTRPGVSAIAGAIATELAVSILQHPEKANAPAFYQAGSQEIGGEKRDDCILGVLPHSVRGFLSTYTHVLPATEKYKQCVACSDVVIKEYEMNEFEFLLKVFDSCKFLEELTGLVEIQNQINDLEVWDLEEMDESE